MKLLKKHLILLLVTGLFSLSSCSSDDGDTESNTVIGTWTLVEINPEAAGDVVGLNDCPNKPLITFQEDGNADWTSYDPDNDCQASTDTGSWVQNSATQYTMNIPGLEPFVGTVEFSSSTRFTFTTTYLGYKAVLTFEK